MTLSTDRTSRRSDATGALGGKKLDAEVVDLELELVDGGVARRHLNRQIRSSLGERGQGVAGARFDERTQIGHATGQGPKLLVKMALHQPNLPVM